MNHYAPPQAELGTSPKPATIAQHLNRALLGLEFVVLIVPVAALYLWASAIILPRLEASWIVLIFIGLWLATLAAILSLGVSVVSIVIDYRRCHLIWHRMPFLGVPVVVSAYFSKHLPATLLFSDVELKNTMFAFVLGAVLFIPLAHSQITLGVQWRRSTQRD